MGYPVSKLFDWPTSMNAVKVVPIVIYISAPYTDNNELKKILPVALLLQIDLVIAHIT